MYAFSMAHPYMQTSVNSNNREIIQRILIVSNIYKIAVPLLRTLRFPEIMTSETTDELGWVTERIE